MVKLQDYQYAADHLEYEIQCLKKKKPWTRKGKLKKFSRLNGLETALKLIVNDYALHRLVVGKTIIKVSNIIGDNNGINT